MKQTRNNLNKTIINHTTNKECKQNNKKQLTTKKKQKQ